MVTPLWKMTKPQIKRFKGKKTTYRRKGWSDKKIEKELKADNLIIRRKDVGRPKRHYINMYYYTPPKPNLLVKTTYHSGKRP